MKTTLLSFIVLFSLLLSCGGSNTSSSSDLVSPESTNSNNNTNDEPILTEKLIGTPFEGFTIGDTFTDCTFIQNEFFTETVAEEDLPIPVFAAFFTSSEEEVIQEAIEIANDAMKPTLDDPDTGIEEDVLVFVDEWRNDARVIIKVDNTFGAGATVNTIGQAGVFGFQEIFGKIFSSNYATDWEIRLSSSIDINNLLIITIHELGHALGIEGHRLINYDEQDSIADLENNSVMLASNPGNELNDYQYMMRHQAENLKNNFGKTYDLFSGSCGEDGEFGDTE